MKFEPNMKVKAALTEWIDERPITDRRIIDQYGTEIVIVKGGKDRAGQERYDVLRGFTLGDGAGVSVDVRDEPIHTVVTHLLSHYQL
jgi:hypothetical protein